MCQILKKKQWWEKEAGEKRGERGGGGRLQTRNVISETRCCAVLSPGGEAWEEE
jgi:hypothetical protein